MAEYTKKATQLVGLAVAKTPRKTLVDLYKQTLVVLGSMPATSTYRKQTEHITKERMDLVNAEEDVVKLEHKINCGQIEEVILQAKNELSLAQQWQDWKAWEAPETSAPAGQW